MNDLFASLAAVALLPAMTGVPPGTAPQALTLALCNGGTITLPLGRNAPASAATPCCAKGCRSRRRNALIERNDEG